MDSAHLLNQTINIEDFTVEICLDNINVQTPNNQILQDYLIVRRVVVVAVALALVMVVEVSALALNYIQSKQISNQWISIIWGEASKIMKIAERQLSF